jgi:hypothetical protein
MLANSQRVELVTKKMVTKLSKIWLWDPGSEILDPGRNLCRISDLGFKKASDQDPYKSMFFFSF